MKFDISEIKEHGLSVSLTRGVQWLGDWVADKSQQTAEIDSDIRFQLDLARITTEVVVTGKVEFVMVSQCSLCLVDVSFPIDLSVKLILSPARGEDEKELVGGETDYETYDGKTIDLNDYLREQINLSIPYKVICRDHCKGLCCGCGKNLNEESCCCNPSIEDSRFAVLKDLRI